MAQCAASNGVTRLESAFRILADVTPRRNFQRAGTFRAWNRVGDGFAFELACIFLVQMFEEFLDVIHDAVAEFNWRELAFFNLRKLEFPFAGHFGRFDFFVHERDDFASALGADKVILLRFDESALFERLDDACLRGWRSEAAFFHGFGIP